MQETEEILSITTEKLICLHFNFFQFIIIYLSVENGCWNRKLLCDPHRQPHGQWYSKNQNTQARKTLEPLEKTQERGKGCRQSYKKGSKGNLYPGSWCFPRRRHQPHTDIMWVEWDSILVCSEQDVVGYSGRDKEANISSAVVREWKGGVGREVWEAAWEDKEV